MPMVWACLIVACEMFMPVVSISCFMSSDVNTVPLSVSICFWKMDMSDLTTEVVSGLRSGTANRYREKMSIPGRMCKTIGRWESALQNQFP